MTRCDEPRVIPGHRYVVKIGWIVNTYATLRFTDYRMMRARSSDGPLGFMALSSFINYVTIDPGSDRTKIVVLALFDGEISPRWIAAYTVQGQTDGWKYLPFEPEERAP